MAVSNNFNIKKSSNMTLLLPPAVTVTGVALLVCLLYCLTALSGSDRNGSTVVGAVRPFQRPSPRIDELGHRDSLRSDLLRGRVHRHRPASSLHRSRLAGHQQGRL